MIKGPIFCEGCCSTIDGQFIAYVLRGGGYICDECINDLQHQDGIEVFPSDGWKQRHPERTHNVVAAIDVCGSPFR